MKCQICTDMETDQYLGHWWVSKCSTLWSF